MAKRERITKAEALCQIAGSSTSIHSFGKFKKSGSKTVAHEFGITEEQHRQDYDTVFENMVATASQIVERMPTVNFYVVADIIDPVRVNRRLINHTSGVGRGFVTYHPGEPKKAEKVIDQRHRRAVAQYRGTKLLPSFEGSQTIKGNQYRIRDLRSKNYRHAGLGTVVLSIEPGMMSMASSGRQSTELEFRDDGIYEVVTELTAPQEVVRARLNEISDFAAEYQATRFPYGATPVKIADYNGSPVAEDILNLAKEGSFVVSETRISDESLEEKVA